MPIQHSEPELAAILDEFRPQQIHRVEEPTLGLLAYIVLDDMRLGPAAGGVRTRPYGSVGEAARDACRLARSMTIKCALAGLDAGGGKIVVLEHPELHRERAFEALGRRVEALGGDLRTAGDLGTTLADLEAMARHTRYVHTDTARLAGAVAAGVMRCAHAAVDFKGRPGLSGLRVAVQGAGDIGAAVARGMIEAGAEVSIADVDSAKAERIADAIGARVISPADVLFADVDLLAPCAVGDVISPEVAARLRAWVVCGGANNICTEEAAHRILHDRGVLHVPDLIASSGAVIEGVGRTVMGIDDRGPILDALGHTARLVLEDAARAGTPPIVHARARAEARMSEARG